MRLRLTLALLAASACLLPTATARAADAATLPARLEAEMAKHPDMGLAVVVFGPDGVVLEAGHGPADRGTGAPATPDTVFRGGSVGKSVVGAAVMRLVEDGRLSLDDRVADLAPDIPFDNPWEATAPLRLVHLLEHTTGWPDLSPREFALDDPGMDLRTGILVGGARTSRYPPGRYHAYSGAGHAIAAHIVSRRAGMPFEAFVHEQLFAPLDMDRTGYRPVDGMARSYTPDGRAVPYQHYPLHPSGGIALSARDLARFARMLAGRGALDGRRVLRPESVLRMERPESTLAARSGLPHGYGLGVQAVVGEAAVLHGHGGSIDGFNALYRYVSGTGRGYAVLGNVDPIPAGVVALLDAAIAQGTGLEARAAATAVPAARVPAAFAGTYQPIAHRNRLMPLVAGLTRFVRVDVAGDALSIDGQPRIVGPALTLRRPERVAPTQVLVRTEEGPELLGGTEALRKVPSWTVQAKAAFGILAALSLLLALGVLVVALVRRRASWAAVAGVLAFVPPVALLMMLGTVMSMHASDQLVLFGQASWLSVGVFVLSLLIPAGGLLALHGALRGRGVARWSAALAAGVVLVATVHLALHGWIGLRTWAL